MSWTQVQDRWWHRQQHLQVERASQAVPDQRRRTGLLRLDPFTEPPRQQAATFDC